MKLAIRTLSIAFASLALLGTSAAMAQCKDCGTVVDVKTVKKQGEGSGAGAVIGGVAGGVLGHQIGSGRGNTAATVVGAGAGAYAGHEIEKNQKSTTSYVVHVKMEDGSNRTFSYNSPTSYRAGDKVKIVDKKLVRQ
jgi:outer membrane lipoprotein SlyB